MTDRLCLVVNPAAGRSRGSRVLPSVLGALAAHPANVRVCRATSLDHAARTAEEAARQGESVVAVGGDGLVGAVAAAVAGAGGVLGIIRAGQGNDFARTLGIPFRPADAAAALVAGQQQTVDLIGVRACDGPEQVVAGSVYVGIISEGGEIASNSRLPAGRIGYQLAGVRALLGWRPATFTVEADPAGGTDSFPGFCVVVANSAYLASGTMAAPAADVTDGLLDVITVRSGSRLSFVRAMAKARRGAHVEMEQVGAYRAREVTVTADRPMPAGADGETLPCASPLAPGSPLRIRALPGALRVIAPAQPAGLARQPSPEPTGRA